MASSNCLFILKLLGLWLAIVALGVVTSMALITSQTRSDCYPANQSTPSVGDANTKCTHLERLSSAAYHHSSYLQSLHIMLLRGVAYFALSVFKPALWSMVWSALERSRPLHSMYGVRKPSMKLASLQNGVELAGTPNVPTSISYIKGSGWEFTWEVTFVILTSVVSLGSPLMVSPIYKSHAGPHPTSINFTNGGGVGIGFSRQLNASDVVAASVVAGRAIVNSASALNIPVPSITHDASVAPFLPQSFVEQVWSATVKTVVARNKLDCGPSAPAPITNSTSIPSFAGFVLGGITNDPQVTTVYLNRTNSSSSTAEWVEVETSILFLAANGILEGAQQKVIPPAQDTLTSKIPFLDVLVCTSTTRLELSSCNIFKGNVTDCNPLPVASNDEEHDINWYIKSPLDVAAILSASPVTAIYRFDDRLPMYSSITPVMVESNVPPLSFLTASTGGATYDIPLSYVRDVLFGQTAQAIVQGCALGAWANQINQQVTLIATFGTSKPWLLYVTMLLSIVCALTATASSTLRRSERQAVPLDLARLLAISRNPQLDIAFEPYADRDADIKKDLLDTEVTYTYVEGLNRHAIVLASLQEESSRFLMNKF